MWFTYKIMTGISLEEHISISYLPGRVVDIGFESADFSMLRLGCILWETKKFLERIQNHVVFVHVEPHNPILVWILIFFQNSLIWIFFPSLKNAQVQEYSWSVYVSQHTEKLKTINKFGP